MYSITRVSLQVLLTLKPLSHCYWTPDQNLWERDFFFTKTIQIKEKAQPDKNNYFSFFNFPFDVVVLVCGLGNSIEIDSLIFLMSYLPSGLAFFVFCVSSGLRGGNFLKFVSLPCLVMDLEYKSASVRAFSRLCASGYQKIFVRAWVKWILRLVWYQPQDPNGWISCFSQWSGKSQPENSASWSFSVFGAFNLNLSLFLVYWFTIFVINTIKFASNQ